MSVYKTKAIYSSLALVSCVSDTEATCDRPISSANQLPTEHAIMLAGRRYGGVSWEIVC